MKKSVAVSIICILAVLAIALGVLYFLNNADKTKQIDTLSADVTEKAGKIEALNADVADKAGQIETLNADVADKAGQIEAMSADVADKAGQIETLNADVAEKTETVRKLNEDLAYKNGQIDMLDADVKEKAAQIEKLKSDVAEKTSQIEALNADVADKAGQIEILTGELDEAKAKVQSLSGELETVKAQLNIAQQNSSIGASEDVPDSEGTYDATKFFTHALDEKGIKYTYEGLSGDNGDIVTSIWTLNDVDVKFVILFQQGGRVFLRAFNVIDYNASSRGQVLETLNTLNDGYLFVNWTVDDSDNSVTAKYDLPELEPQDAGTIVYLALDAMVDVVNTGMDELKPFMKKGIKTATDDPAATVMSYEDFVNAELASTVCVEAYVQASQAWWAKDGVGRMTLYLQDENHGAYFAYEVLMEEEESRKLVPGTKIRISGLKAEWSGEVEIFDAKYEILEGSFIAEPEDVTALLGTDELVKHINEKIALKDLKVAASKVEGKEEEFAFLYSWDGSGSHEGNSDLYFNVEVNGQTYTLTVESYLCGNDTDVYKAVEGLKVGDTIDAEGFLYWYNGANPHITKVTVK